MALHQFVVIGALIAVAQCGLAPVAIPAAAPLVKAAAVVRAEEYDPHPQYTYAYNIEDALTGDSKSQHETREGDVVQGSYSLIEADGTRRTVNYVADPINGFNAVVHREPAVLRAAIAATPVVKAAPVAVPAPIVAKAPFAAYSAAPLAPAPFAYPGFGLPAYV